MIASWVHLGHRSCCGESMEVLHEAGCAPWILCCGGMTV
jgi:hypothetical protein